MTTGVGVGVGVVVKVVLPVITTELVLEVVLMETDDEELPVLIVLLDEVLCEEVFPPLFDELFT